MAETTAKKEKKNLVKLACQKCKRLNYRVSKTRRLVQEQEKLKLKKYCSACRQRTLHEEVR